MTVSHITRKFASVLVAIKAAWQRRRFASKHPANNEPPLRAELFSANQMEQHGHVLANAHQLGTVSAGNQLLGRLSENQAELAQTCRLLREAIHKGRQITPAAEWLLDNYYLLNEQIRTTREHLPKNYSRELPCLAKGTFPGFPRVYDIALEIISHGDGRVDQEALSRFVGAYQQVTTLTLGELWAIPIMLRLALIENLRRVGSRLASSRHQRNLADLWVDKMTEAVEKDPADLILLVADMARSDPPMVGAFVAELARRLHGQGPSLMLPLTWLSQHLGEQGQTVDALIQEENQQQAADQVSVSNSIGSLRFLSSIDWRDFVESLSQVEQTLRTDAAKVYAQMDFATRDQYRHVIERVSKLAHTDETDIARQAVNLAQEASVRHTAQQATPRLHSDPRTHVGYYLIGDGLPKLEHCVGARLPWWQRLLRACRKAPLLCYLGPVAILTALFCAGLAWQARYDSLPSWGLEAMAIAAIIAGSQLAVAIINWLITLRETPKPLPRMDFSEGIPDAFATLVAVPSMLFTEQNADQLCEALEVRFLANRDTNLRYCLLTDLGDAATETTENDQALVARASANIEELNNKYGSSRDTEQRGDIFLLLHRDRKWNARENTWMGYERKRGKLADLNAFLRRKGHNPFSVVTGDITAVEHIKYVITLDTDTHLARDSARRFVATMAHILNRPAIDATTQCVVQGYGILQPRVATSLPSELASRYSNLFGDESGIDPYTRTVSDVYQDVFKEGSFIGKGIYDVDVFEQVLAGRFPENRILSHDLLEGCYTRCGLISDVQLHEGFPARYSSDAKRRHRWMRGDWQLLPWLLTRVPDTRTQAGHDAKTDARAATSKKAYNSRRAMRRSNPLSALSRWKILDNLRRSLVPAALLLLLLLGWAALPKPWLWTGTVLAVVFLPPVLASLIDLARKPKALLLSQHLAAALRGSRQRLTQALLSLAFMPYETWQSIDAIACTLWRMLATHRHMLQWTPSGQASAGTKRHCTASFRRMWANPLVAVATAALLTWAAPATLWIAAPFLLLWLVGPAIEWWISQPLGAPQTHLGTDQYLFLHRLARRTWAFFDTYLGPDDNWLPPDNIQHDPVDTIAHRTSPTNIGLALLATLAARDFGYIGIAELLQRLRQTLATMASLERYRGHFFNWYDTQQLKPLNPHYVSVVDSGNLAGHLMTLESGLQMLADQPIVDPQQLLQGMADTYAVLCEEINATARTDDTTKTGDAAGQALPAALREFGQALPASADHNHQDRAFATLTIIRTLRDHIDTFINTSNLSTDTAAHRWALALQQQCNSAHNELTQLVPWCQVSGSAQANPQLAPFCTSIPTLRQLAGYEPALHDVDISDNDDKTMLISQLMHASRQASDLMALADSLADQAHEFAHMDFRFLYNKTTQLLAIGYNVSEGRRDASYYDLLASEARLCNFVAIAQNQLPQDSWFALGRQLTLSAGEPALLSWSGSMFEYLMPLLVMPSFRHSLLEQTYRAVTKRQIEYGTQRGVPWGVSESAFYTFDASLNYQYRAFGVPGLGIKRGLSDDLVIAPYASMLALMVEPDAACANLQKMAAAGMQSEHGFFEAIDYTPARLPRGKSQAMVMSFMAHHQGMGFLALAYLLLDQPMQKRFHANPQFQATMLLLQERIPKGRARYTRSSDASDVHLSVSLQDTPVRVIDTARTRRPEVQLLSNGRYHVMLTNSGAGASRWQDLAVTRWQEDPTRDHWGTFCYVRDLGTGQFWSTAFQPTLQEPRHYEAVFSEDRVEYRRLDHGIEMHTEIVVSPEDDIELRRTRITNRSHSQRRLDITSYAEVVLASAAADNAHPAFGKLFVQTRILPDKNAILCTRRPRSRSEKAPWFVHLLSAHGAACGPLSFDTSRASFIGQGASTISPDAMRNQHDLPGNQGSVLDPIAAIRCPIVLEPDEQIVIDRVLGMAETRNGALHLIDKYQDRYLADRVFELAWTHNHVILRQLNATDADARLYSQLASAIVYASPRYRADANTLRQNHKQQSGLWGHGISGDLPIVLLHIQSADNIELARQLIQAHAYWRHKGLAVDLVIWNEDHASYRQRLQDDIMGLIVSGVEAQSIDRPGGIYVRMAEQIPDEDRILLQSVARVVLADTSGTLAEQLGRRPATKPRVTLLPVFKNATDSTETDASAPNESGSPELIAYNGLGGFDPDTNEYVIVTEGDNAPPAPWVNILASPEFGSVVSHSGQAYSWRENAHEFRLTPWHNDPVTDSSGEAFYLRNENTGHVWSPTSLPAPGTGPYTTRHGFGYSIFEHTEGGVWSQLTTFVAHDAPVKYALLNLRNDSNETVSLSATGYVQWVLGDTQAKTAMHIVTDIDPASNAIVACNPFSNEFFDRTAFFNCDASTRTITADRSEFIGRNGALKNPDALRRIKLSGRTGTALDPCAAIQTPIELVAGQTREIVFVLGALAPHHDRAIMATYSHAEAAHQQFDKVVQFWQHTLGTVQVATPDPTINALANGWLVYQTMACRLWARSGFYQSGGAYGFRDQLQDAMALVHAAPATVREHLLRAAARQFVQGDVQHWWHPPTGRGVRTHCSDDYLWLPLAVCRYVRATGDDAVLDEEVGFLEGRAVAPQEDSYYDLPGHSSQTASVYQHCVRAIEYGLKFGAHGLPLIGSCDWNDGMDKVGDQGAGESVWLGFFLCHVLGRFARLADDRNDNAFAEKCRMQAVQLQANIDKHGWDGEWYKRAYFDDGTPLGSHENVECQIDAISQSWAVLSGAGDPDRAAQAMQTVDTRLVRRDHGLIQLLDPPFDKSPLDPGYIRGYVPGVRENGGQYTHAAIWTVMAFARLGQHDRAWELLDMINPVSHGATPQTVATYKVEPYVMAADVYAASPHTGRGGWTWYTGSAGWMYRLVVESLLGLDVRAGVLTVTPCLRADWDGYSLRYRYGAAVYAITIRRGDNGGTEAEVSAPEKSGLSVISLAVDGVLMADLRVVLCDDGDVHEVEVVVG